MDMQAAMEFVAGRKHGVLATLKADGRPQLSNILYHAGDDGVIRISVTDGRAKTANLRRDPRASLHVTRDDFYAYVVVEATAELSATAAATDDEAVEELVAMYRAAVGEHPDWDEFRQAMVDDRRLALRLRPERAYGMLSLPS
jgi:PPOX class probable F420-dependent enzyme